MEHCALLEDSLKNLSANLLTVEESAEKLGISRRAVDRLIQRGRLPKILFKGKPFIWASDISYYQLRKKQRESQRKMYAQKNLFKGVNPLLMSLLQTTGAYKSIYPAFHASHITHLSDFLNEQLPSGYRAMGTQSLQVLRSEDGSPFVPDKDFIPDVSIFKNIETGSPQREADSQSGAAPALVLTLAATLPREQTLLGVGIFKTGQHPELGEPIVRLELLSPSNKLPHTDAAAYIENRRKCFQAGTNLIEIDFLHETRSPIVGIPVYPDDPNAQPYSIAVSRPEQNTLSFYPFGIQQEIPTLAIPLEGEKQLVFNFDAVYQHTFEKGRWGELPSIDYMQEPLRMHTYSQRDQTLILEFLHSLRG